MRPRTLDEFLKKALYAKMGVPEYWVIDPVHGRLTLFRAENGAYTSLARFDRASTVTSPAGPSSPPSRSR